MKLTKPKTDQVVKVPKTIDEDLEMSVTDAAVAVAKLVPGLGAIVPMADLLAAVAPTLELWNVLGPTLERRQTNWIRHLYKGLEELAQKVDGLPRGSIMDDPHFVDVLLQASQAAIRTSKEETQEALRNAVLNTAIQINLTEEKQQMFLRYLSELQVSHIHALQFFSAPKEWIDTHSVDPMYRGQVSASGSSLLEGCVPGLGGDREICNVILSDLADRHLIKSDAAEGSFLMREGYILDPNNSARLQSGSLQGRAEVLTAFGQAFLAYINLPSQLAASQTP